MSRSRKPAEILKWLNAKVLPELPEHDLEPAEWRRIVDLLPVEVDLEQVQRAITYACRFALSELEWPRLSAKEMKDCLDDLRSKVNDVRHYLHQPLIHSELLGTDADLKLEDNALVDLVDLQGYLEELEDAASHASESIDVGSKSRRPELHILGNTLAQFSTSGAIPLPVTKYHEQPMVEIFQVCCESIGLKPPENCLRYLTCLTPESNRPTK